MVTVWCSGAERGGMATDLASEDIREDFDSKIRSKRVDEHLYTPSTRKGIRVLP